MDGYNVAIVGTGAVGQMILKVLEERNFPINQLKLLATKRSAGKEFTFAGNTYTVEETTEHSFKGIDIALFAGGKASEIFAQAAVEHGAVVIDNSSAFRLDPKVPLIVPEVNAFAAKDHQGIIANPNCSTIQMAVALKPLHDLAIIKRAVVSTYQAVSGAGNAGVDELYEQTEALLKGKEFSLEAFPYQIAFNILPHIDVFLDNDYSKEEMKMVNETKKIFDDDSIKITVTAVRVPVHTGHAESINLETERKISSSEAKRVLASKKGIEVIDDLSNLKYPMPIDCVDSDTVYIGRIREDDTVENGLNIWVVADNLRKGAATNAVQIAEELVEQNLV